MKLLYNNIYALSASKYLQGIVTYIRFLSRLHMTFYHGFLDNLRGDIYGGLTAAVVALPLAL